MAKLYEYNQFKAYHAMGKAAKSVLDDGLESSLPDAPIVDMHQMVKDLDHEANSYAIGTSLTDSNLSFCNPCRRLFDDTGQSAAATHQRSGGGSYYSHCSGDELQKSALSGCPMCLLVQRTFESERPAEAREEAALTYDFARYMTFEQDVKRFVVRFFSDATLGHDPGEALHCSAITLQDTDCESNSTFLPDLNSETDFKALQPFITHSPATTSTGHSESLKQLATWLDTCNLSHTCNDAQHEQGFLPSRLIRVDEGSGPFLVVSHEVHKDANYATLSHCWGSIATQPNRMTLMKHNLESFKNEIPAEALPKTFREAIHVTRTLGLQYLWIDSLCIIQDSKEDWEVEAEKMGEVYANSFLNISADASRSSDQGLFRDRPPGTNQPCFAHIPSDHRQFDTGDYLCYEVKEWVRLVDKAPVNSRGWVLQERFLSPRIAHFCQDQILWECHTMRCSERFAAGIPPTFEQGTIRPVLHPAADFQQDSRTLLEQWEYIIGRYTASHLTFSSDKLIAVSALAGRTADMFGAVAGEYLAGLWQAQLPGQLLWRSASAANSRFSSIPGSTDYRAPSWSWASVDGPIDPNFDWSSYGPRGSKFRSRPMLKVVNAAVERTSPFAFGPVRSGCLRVSVPMLKVSLIPADWEEPATKRLLDHIYNGRQPNSAAGPASSAPMQATQRRKKTRTKRLTKAQIIEVFSSRDPNYTGETMRSMAISYGDDLDAYQLFIDVEHGLVSTDTSELSNAMSWATEKFGIDLKALMPLDAPQRLGKSDPAADLQRQISFGIHHAKVCLDQISNADADSKLFLAPTLCYSGIEKRLDQEAFEIQSIGALVLKESSRGQGKFERIAVCEFGDRASAEFFCALGNQDNADMRQWKRSTADLKLDDVVPERWPCKELDFIPKTLACYDVEII